MTTRGEACHSSYGTFCTVHFCKCFPKASEPCANASQLFPYMPGIMSLNDN